ncbi:MAG: AAA family ATPase, partial [Gammaproteobacteria bacterium]
PDFAVNMLENIKHIFEVEGVQFVLVTNFDQLKASINHCYGNGLDAQRYLDKFVQFSLSLADTHKPNGPEAVLASITHLRKLLVNSDLLDNAGFADPHEGVRVFLEALVATNRLSLREVETLVRYLEIYQTLTGKEGLSTGKVFGYRLLRAFGVFLYCFKPSVAESMVRGTPEITQLTALFGKTELFRDWEHSRPNYPDLVIAMIAYELKDCGEAFACSEDERSHWEEIFSACFQGGFFGPDRYSQVVVGAIETMKLAG